MSLRYLLDTNTLSEPLKQQPDSGVLEGFRKHWAQSAIPAPAWHELHFGAQRLPPSRRRRDLERYLEETLRPVYPVLAYDGEAATWHATQRARLVRQGQTPPFVDGQIAAIAVVNRLILVTANARDYEAFDGLILEDWRSKRDR